MSRDYKVYLEDIAQAIAKIQKYLSGLDWSEPSKDSKTYDAIVRNLEIIGEAAKNLPPEFKNSEPTIEWRKIAGFRDILSHQYFGIDEAIIGDVIRKKLPVLEIAVRKKLGKYREDASGVQEPPAFYGVKKPRAKASRAPAKGLKARRRKKK